MSLSFTPNNDNGYVSRMASEKLSNKNQFAFYFSDSQNFLTVGDSLDYLASGSQVKYS